MTGLVYKEWKQNRWYILSMIVCGFAPVLAVLLFRNEIPHHLNELRTGGMIAGFLAAGALQIIGKDSLQNIHSEKSLSAVQSVHNRCGFKPFKQAGERCVSRFRRQSCTNCSFSCLFYSSVSFLVTERNSSISSTVLQWSGEIRTIPSVLNSPTCLE